MRSMTFATTSTAPGSSPATLHDLAAAVAAIFEQLLNAVDGRPVVHRVNDELAGHRGSVEGRELVERDRQHHDVGVPDGIGCPSWLGSRYQHLGNECDPLGVT